MWGHCSNVSTKVVRPIDHGVRAHTAAPSNDNRLKREGEYEMKKIIILLGILMALGFSGCATGTKVSNDQIDKFIKGKTTKDEVVAAFGGPQDFKVGGGKQILIYKYKKSGAFVDEEDQTTFIFNDKGILEDIMISQGS